MNKIVKGGSIITLLLLAVVAVFGSSFHPEIAATVFKGISLKHVITAGMMPAVLDTTRGRAALDRIQAIADSVFQLGPNISGTSEPFIVSPSYIRSEVVIKNVKTTYQFEVRDTVLQGQSAARPLVRGVKDNDVAFAYQIGLFIDSRVPLSSDVFLNSAPNSDAFTASGATWNHLQAFYNGELFVQVGSTVFIDNFSTYEFFNARETQQSGATNLSQFTLDENSKRFDPYPIFSGKSDNTVNVNIKSFAGFDVEATEEGFENVVTFFCGVITVRNGANAIDYFRGKRPNANTASSQQIKR